MCKKSLSSRKLFVYRKLFKACPAVLEIQTCVDTQLLGCDALSPRTGIHVARARCAR
jgi:hypothetical protein